MVLQILFYIVAILGYFLKDKKIPFKIIFVPYYFLFMNVYVFQGAWRLIKDSQRAEWAKAKRARKPVLSLDL